MAEYTSPILYHFVGRRLDGDDEQFKLLLSICRDGLLAADLHEQFQSIEAFDESVWDNLGEIAALPAVCFADIPLESLAIHTSKYSEFGLGFTRRFLVEQGVRPVWYIPKSAPLLAAAGPSSQLGIHFAELHNAVGSLSRLLWDGLDDLHATDPNVLSDDRSAQDAIRKLSTLRAFLLADIGWHFKMFDDSLEEDDSDNYYMEREWRSVKRDIKFSATDIAVVIVPNADFAGTVSREFPGLRVETIGAAGKG